MNPKNTPPAGTKTHKPNCGCPVCKRVRGRQEPMTGEPKVGGFASPIAVPSIAEAHELAANPKALELAQKLAKAESDLAAKQAQYNAQETLFSNVRTECASLKRELAEAARKIGELERIRVAHEGVLLARNAEIHQAEGTIEECRNRIGQLRTERNKLTEELVKALEHADETLERLHAYRDRHNVWDVNMDLCWDDVRAALAQARGQEAPHV